MLDRHLEDYKVLKSQMDDMQTVLHEVNGGVKVLRFIGWIMTGGLAMAVWHAVSFLFHPKM